jgi:hypothetical protein
MKKILGMIILCAFLGACQTNPDPVDVVTVHNEVIEPNASLMRCDLVPLPDTFKNNKEAASFMGKVVARNKVCHNNMVSVKTFLDNAKKTVEAQ